MGSMTATGHTEPRIEPATLSYVEKFLFQIIVAIIIKIGAIVIFSEHKKVVIKILINRNVSIHL